MSVDMLDSSFTKLSPEEKDLQQRTYAGINELIMFLIDPLKEVAKKNQFKAVEDKIKREKAAFKP